MVFNHYLGQFKNGLRDGLGSFYYADGSRYQGQWKDGMKHGIAEHTRDDGSCTDGVFENDRMTVKLATRLDEKDSLLSNPYTNIDDIQDVGNSTFVEATPNAANKTNNQLGEEELKDLVESRIDVLNNTQSHLQQNNPLLNQTNVSLLAPPGNRQESLTSSKKLEGNTPKPLAGAARRANKANLNPVPKPVVTHLQANPYLGLINIDDLLEKLPTEERFSVSPVMLESFLRMHSILKEIYTNYSKDHPGKNRNGAVLTREEWWRFIRQFRLCTCRATPPQIDRLIANGKKNNFNLESTIVDITATVEKVKDLAKQTGNLPEIFHKNPSSDKDGLARLASFEEDKSDDDKAEKERQKMNQSDTHRGSISLDIDIVELMTDPTTYAEVTSFDRSTRSSNLTC